MKMYKRISSLVISFVLMGSLLNGFSGTSYASAESQEYYLRNKATGSFIKAPETTATTDPVITVSENEIADLADNHYKWRIDDAGSGYTAFESATFSNYYLRYPDLETDIIKLLNSIDTYKTKVNFKVNYSDNFISMHPKEYSKKVLLILKTDLE